MRKLFVVAAISALAAYYLSGCSSGSSGGGNLPNVNITQGKPLVAVGHSLPAGDIENIEYFNGVFYIEKVSNDPNKIKYLTISENAGPAGQFTEHELNITSPQLHERKLLLVDFAKEELYAAARSDVDGKLELMKFAANGDFLGHIATGITLSATADDQVLGYINRGMIYLAVNSTICNGDLSALGNALTCAKHDNIIDDFSNFYLLSNPVSDNVHMATNVRKRALDKPGILLGQDRGIFMAEFGLGLNTSSYDSEVLVWPVEGLARNAYKKDALDLINFYTDSFAVQDGQDLIAVGQVEKSVSTNNPEILICKKSFDEILDELASRTPLSYECRSTYMANKLSSIELKNTDQNDWEEVLRITDIELINELALSPDQQVIPVVIYKGRALNGSAGLTTNEEVELAIYPAN